MVSRAGYVKRLSPDTWRSQHRGGKGLMGASTREEDSLDQIFVASTHSSILLFTEKGFCHWLKVYRIPEESRQSKGKAIVNLVDLQEGDRVVAQVCVRSFDTGAFVVMATSMGMLKKTPLSEYSRPRRRGIRAVRLPEGARLISAALTSGSSELMLATASGRSNRFPEDLVRTTGRFTSGVRGIRLDRGDQLVSMVVLGEDGDILTMTANGFGKRSPLSDYPLHGRGGKGVINIRGGERNGPVVAVRLVRSVEDMILVSARGMVIRFPVDGVRLCGRGSMGVRLMGLPSGDRIVDAAIVQPEDADAADRGGESGGDD
jgi:DNA gyrase subunit A